MELGRVGFKTRDVEDLLTLYGVVDDAERRALLEMVREANTPRVVAQVLGRAADVVHHVHRPGGGRERDPHL
ncbi:hypothetical protein GCM10020001_078940 [Nonomuraea salmonea]